MRTVSYSSLTWLICVSLASNPTSSTSTGTQRNGNVLSRPRPIEGLRVKDLVDSKINGFLRRFGAVAPRNATYNARSPYELNKDISDKQDTSSHNSAEKTGMVNVNFLLMGITYPPGRANPNDAIKDGQTLGNYQPHSLPLRGYDSTEWNVQPESFISPVPGDLMQSRGTFASNPWPVPPPLPYYGARAPYAGPFDFGYGGGYPFPYGRLPGLYGPGPMWPVF